MTTASHPTTPESQPTLAIQIAQLKDGIRHVVMFPKGTSVPGKAKDIGMREIVTGGNRFWHNPAKIKAGEIAAASKKNELPSILGNDGYGAPDKSHLHGPTVAVVSETKAAVPVQDILTDRKSLPKAVKSAERLTPPGGSVKIKPPAQVISQRKADPNKARLDAMRGISKMAAAGDIQGALKTAGAHVRSGILNDSHVEKALERGGPGAIVAGFNMVPELHHAMRVFHSANPEHQNLLRPHLIRRVEEMGSKPPAEQNRVMGLLKDHGFIPKEIRL